MSVRNKQNHFFAQENHVKKAKEDKTKSEILDDAFNPASLFATGEGGFWYDPSDISTMFQDAAGTTPVTAVGQPVGLCLDKSKGLVLGSAVAQTFGVTGTNATNTASVLSSGFSLSQIDATSLVTGFFVTPNVAGKWYQVEFDLALTSGSFKIDGAQFAQRVVFFTSGRHKVYLLATGAGGTSVGIYRNAPTPETASIGTFTNISVRELPGNHRSQSVSLNRPTLRQDTNGLYYLEYDGLNDSLSTAPFAWGTDKATVVAGVRKLSDAAGDEVIVEASANSDSTNGAFRLGTNAATFTWRSRGTVSADTSGAGAQPISAVLTGIGDISGDVARLRRTGVQVGEVLTDQGTGNFGTHPVFFGARAGTSLFFNGREYSQVAINRLLTADELTQIERYTAQRTGVTL